MAIEYSFKHIFIEWYSLSSSFEMTRYSEVYKTYLVSTISGESDLIAMVIASFLQAVHLVLNFNFYVQQKFKFQQIYTGILCVNSSFDYYMLFSSALSSKWGADYGYCLFSATYPFGQQWQEQHAKNTPTMRESLFTYSCRFAIQKTKIYLILRDFTQVAGSIVYTWCDRIDIQKICTLPHHHMMDPAADKSYSFFSLKSLTCLFYQNMDLVNL